jgi:hypothetical protein
VADLRQGSKKYEAQSSARNRAVAQGVNALRRLIVGASVRLLPRRLLDSVEVVVFSGDGDPEEHMTRILGALQLIREYSPRRYARVTRDLRRIAIVARGGEIYDHALGTYMVDLQVLQRRSTEEVALAIVHEATHARLWRWNIETTRHNEPRIERLCVAQEIEFASHLPHGNSLIEHAKEKLGRPWWGEATRERRAEDQLASLGVPGFILAARRMIRKHVRRFNAQRDADGSSGAGRV